MAAYAAAILGAATLAGLVLELWKADLSIPLVPRITGDVLFYQMLVKGMIDNGGYLHNRFLGMPWGQELFDYPMADQLHLLVLKALSLSCGAAAAINVYFLASFPLAAVCALAAMRELGISRGPAVVASLLFSLLPFHFQRGETHLFLAVYFLVPLVLMVALWISLGRPLLVPRAGPRGPWRLASRGFVALAVVALSGVAGIYHVFFSGFFLAVGGVVGAVAQRSLRPLVAAAVLIVVLFATVVAALSPSLLYIAREGRNPLAANRQQFETELLGLKIAHLLLPVPGHRFAPLAKLRRRYDRGHPWPLENENRMAALGLAGSIGFLCLLTHLLFGWPRSRDGDSLAHLAKLAFAAVMLGSMGGFSSLVALLVSPEIRGYNRVSVFVAFLSLTAVGILLDRLAARSQVRPGLVRAVLVLLLVIGVLDQTTADLVPPYPSLAASVASDRAFVRQIEASLPADAMVFQLPQLTFFEGDPVNRSTAYEPLSLYLQSRRLRWSYGAMKGRAAGEWQRDLAERPLEEQTEHLALVGFAGITVDRFGYPDGGAETERRLATELGTAAVESPDRRYAFFDLEKFAYDLRASADPKSYSRRREAVLHPAFGRARPDAIEPGHRSMESAPR